MSIRVFLHTSNKRAETAALLDSGATENFISKKYAQWLRLLFKKLEKPRAVYNVDGSKNKQGDIRFYTDLEVQTGEQKKNMRFFLTDLGPQNMILGYPWFAGMQPNIDWAKGWLDYSQLPVVLRTQNAHKARFGSRIRNHPCPLWTIEPPIQVAYVSFSRKTPDDGVEASRTIHNPEYTTNPRGVQTTPLSVWRGGILMIPWPKGLGSRN